MPHGYEKVSVDDIRQQLENEFGITDQEVLQQSKKPLVELLLSRLDENPELDNVVEEEDNILTAVPNESIPDETEAVPIIYSPRWSDYVLRQFTDDELKDGNPTCDGCRRLVEQLIGVLGDQGVSEYTPGTKDNRGTATVVYVVNIHIANESHPSYNNNIAVTEIADCGPHNTETPYCNHAPATAATRAEGRCYRKLLRLRNIITAEEKSEQAEISDDGWSPDNPIDDNQIQVIDMVCKRLDIGVVEFINSGKSDYDNIELVPKTIAAKMLQELNKIQRGVKEKPQTINNYDPNWRNSNESTN